MIRKLLATLGILFSLMIVLAFTITLPEQGGEPTITLEPWAQTATQIMQISTLSTEEILTRPPATLTAEANYIDTAIAQELTQPRLTPLESWEQTATRIVLTVTEGAPGYQTPESATITAESITSTAIYIEYVQNYIIRELTSTAYAVTFVPTYTAIAETQEHVEATRRAIESQYTRVPLFETATQIANDELDGTPSHCYFRNSFSQTIVDGNIELQIRDELARRFPEETNILFWTYTSYFGPDSTELRCQRNSYSQLHIAVGGVGFNHDDIVNKVDSTLEVLNRYLASGYEAVFPSPRLEFMWWTYEDEDYYHYVRLDTDYHAALSLYQSGVRGDDLIEALGGMYPYLEERLHG